MTKISESFTSLVEKKLEKRKIELREAYIDCNRRIREFSPLSQQLNELVSCIDNRYIEADTEGAATTIKLGIKKTHIDKSSTNTENEDWQRLDIEWEIGLNSDDRWDDEDGYRPVPKKGSKTDKYLVDELRYIYHTTEPPSESAMAFPDEATAMKYFITEAAGYVSTYKWYEIHENVSNALMEELREED